jgi:hypothetical protein
MPSRNRFPSNRKIRAQNLGADELHARLEWLLRNRTRALCAARQRYSDFCDSLLARIESHGSPVRRGRLERAA